MKINLDYKEGVRKLLAEYEQVIYEEIKKGLEWREKIENNELSQKDCEKLLKHICGQILVQGRGAKGVETQIKKIERMIGQWNIENLEKNLNNIGMSERKREKLKKILEYLKEHGIRKWIMDLHNDNKSTPSMGPKSDDDFLKTHGFYEHIPIDRHTQRFLFRTGILHWYFKSSGDDVLNILGGNSYVIFKRALISFCKTFGDDIYFEVPDKGKLLKLADNPGILDIVIWRHCGEHEKLGCKNICGRTPKCSECIFKEHCLWNMLQVNVG